MLLSILHKEGHTCGVFYPQNYLKNKLYGVDLELMCILPSKQFIQHKDLTHNLHKDLFKSYGRICYHCIKPLHEEYYMGSYEDLCVECFDNGAHNPENFSYELDNDYVIDFRRYMLNTSLDRLLK